MALENLDLRQTPANAGLSCTAPFVLILVVVLVLENARLVKDEEENENENLKS